VDLVRLQMRMSEKPYHIIAVSEVCDFIRDHQGQETISKADLKGQPWLEAFLKFSLLYFDDGSKLTPYRIKGFENDFCKALRVNINGYEIHKPFLSRLAFLSKIDGKRVLSCHPDSVSDTEKIVIQGFLESSSFYDQSTDVFSRIFEEYSGSIKSAYLDETLAKKEFFNRHLKKIIKLAPQLDLEFQEIARKTKSTMDFCSEANRILLERVDSDFRFRDLRVTRVLAFLEHMEKVVQPYSYPLGVGSTWRDTKSYNIIGEMCKLNTAALDTIVGRSHLYARYYENYTDPQLRGYTYLTCHMDSLGYIAFLQRNLLEIEKWPRLGIHSETKRLKMIRHANLYRNYAAELPVVLEKKEELTKTKEILRNSGTLLLDLNFPDDLSRKILEVEGASGYESCPFNVYVINEICPTTEQLKQNILQVVMQLKDIYYPHLRFLICSRLGLRAQIFDRKLAELLRRDMELRKKLWLYASKGIESTEHVIQPELVNTLGRFLDRVAYRG